MSVPKLEGPWLQSGETLVCFGDSLTSAANGYVKILQEKLQFRGIKVVNAGLAGDKTPQALTRLQPLSPEKTSVLAGIAYF